MAKDDDRLIDEEETATTPSDSAARLFDVRRVIGGLFVVYGVVVGIVGLADGGGQLAKAQGVRINLWAGLAMLVFGVLMLLWQWLSPVRPPTRSPDESSTQPSTPTSGADERPPTDGTATGRSRDQQ
jgi:hypothetical protein